MATTLKETPELGIYQLNNNKKIGKDNARWIVIPDAAFTFKGFNYMDETEMFQQELAHEAEAESQYAHEQETLLQSILSIPMHLNLAIGYVGNRLISNPSETLESFLKEVDDIEQEQIHGLELLDGATTEEEYESIKAHNLAYFLDGSYQNDTRDGKYYLGGKRLIAIDIDHSNYTRAEIEQQLEAQDLFGIVYRTARYYFNGDNRWRIVMMADQEMDKEQYRQVVEGLSNMLNLEMDDASKKLSQLMGYPLRSEDVSTVIGGMVNAAQFIQEKPKKQTYRPQNVVDFQPNPSTKSLLDFNHEQARIVKEIITGGIAKGERNEKYYQACLFLRDTANNPDWEPWHKEALELIELTRSQAFSDGLTEKEVELIYR